MSLSILSTFGFHWRVNVHYENERLKNITNIVGYFPIVGTIAGIYRMIMNYPYLSFSVPTAVLLPGAAEIWEAGEALSRRSFHVAEFSRGIIETLGGGFLLIVPDIIITAGRALFNWQ